MPICLFLSYMTEGYWNRREALPQRRSAVIRGARLTLSSRRQTLSSIPHFPLADKPAPCAHCPPAHRVAAATRNFVDVIFTNVQNAKFHFVESILICITLTATGLILIPLPHWLILQAAGSMVIVR